MTRIFSPISETDLKTKVWETLSEKDDQYLYLSHSKMRKFFGNDLKVAFNFENFDYNKENYHDNNSLLGLCSLDSGLVFWGMQAGGDWEFPVFFIIYWNGKRLRAYIPTQGNPWNTTTRRAYGNDDEADLKNARKRWPLIFKDSKEVEADSFDFDFDLIKEDIVAHILRKEDS